MHFRTDIRIKKKIKILARKELHLFLKNEDFLFNFPDLDFNMGLLKKICICTKKCVRKWSIE
ncbi:hypothetical protein BpHYR1_049907 [Brachionus plicatilis]|uniref:Uncharacterized protein n=1 Tax=Brachionus plicatilis TaxID=10195 RepID=A0A3M7QFQ8_BRAPC|nr:hypothetical protein BpHYR1_049907 [Brachionus plicatilis]